MNHEDPKKIPRNVLHLPKRNSARHRAGNQCSRAAYHAEPGTRLRDRERGSGDLAVSGNGGLFPGAGEPSASPGGEREGARDDEAAADDASVRAGRE